jgi:hypothetical protein
MSAEENKRLVRRFYEEIDKGNLDAMDELVDENYLDYNPPPFPGLASGRCKAWRSSNGTSTQFGSSGSKPERKTGSPFTDSAP